MMKIIYSAISIILIFLIFLSCTNTTEPNYQTVRIDTKNFEISNCASNYYVNFYDVTTGELICKNRKVPAIMIAGMLKSDKQIAKLDITDYEYSITLKRCTMFVFILLIYVIVFHKFNFIRWSSFLNN